MVVRDVTVHQGATDGGEAQATAATAATATVAAAAVEEGVDGGEVLPSGRKGSGVVLRLGKSIAPRNGPATSSSSPT